MTPRRTLRRFVTRAAVPSLTLALVLAAAGNMTPANSQSLPPSSPAAASSNPLAAAPWGVTTGNADGAYPAWNAANGTTKTLLGQIALRPRVQWFGAWTPTNQIQSFVHTYITQTQNGNPNALVQLAVFRIFPDTEGNSAVPLTPAEQTAYKAWIDQVALAIGSTPVAIILEPDLALALGHSGTATRLSLVSYAANELGSLPRSSVYIDAASADWLSVADATSMLLQAGVAHVRGFALNATHYDATSTEITYGQGIASALVRAGVPDPHFVVNTADTGQPFTWNQYWAKHPHGTFNNAEVCGSLTEHQCVALGIPPTTDVAAPTWHLPASVAAAAARWCDAYLWYGRPWLDDQSQPFDVPRSVAIANTSPYLSATPGLAVLSTTGVVSEKAGLNGAWVTEQSGASAIAAATDVLNGPSLASLTPAGVVTEKTGLTGSWVTEQSGESAIALASDSTHGPSLAVLTPAGVLSAKTGLYGGWVTELSGVSAFSISSDPLHGPSIAVLTTSGAVYEKTGLYGGWVKELSGVSVSELSVASDSAGGPSLVVLTTGGIVDAKTGLYGSWVTEQSGVSAIALATDANNGPSLAVLNSAGVVSAKTGLYGSWVTELSGVSALSMSSDPVDGPSLAVLTPAGVASEKTGLYGGWVDELPGVSTLAASG